MSGSQKSAEKQMMIVGIVIITVGVGWLLTALGAVPGIDWIWTLGLALVGVLAFVFGKINKATVVVGPFFLLASLLSVIRQTGKLDVNVEVPILVMAFGVLLLVARSPKIPMPDWVVDDKKEASE